MSDARSTLITGCSSGFGNLTARTLVEAGHDVVATMRDVETRNADAAGELKEFADGQPGTLRVLELDVTRDEQVRDVVARADELTGGLDVVVNNAGLGSAGYAECFTMEQFRTVFDVDLFGVQRVSRAVLPGMRGRGSGLLVQVSSIMGRIVLPFAAPYTAAKFAMEGLAESYRYELAGTGVDVVIVEPGGFPTDFGSNIMGAADRERTDSYGPRADLPQRVWGGLGEQLASEGAPDPQVVADTILELIETPAGERPLRVVVDPMMGGDWPTAVNETAARVQSDLLSAIGLPEADPSNGSA